MRNRNLVALLAALLAIVLMTGCSSANAVAVQTTTSQRGCEGAIAPANVIVTDGSNAVCPNVIGQLSPNSGYQAFIYHIPASGMMHIMTRGGADVLSLEAVLYMEQLASGTRGILVFQKSTTYDVASVQCSTSQGFNALAEPQYAVVFVPSNGTLHPSALTGDIRTDGDVQRVATDPIFGLPVAPEAADALCAQPAGI